MSDTTTGAALGTPHLLEHDGKTYRFRLIDKDAQAAFQRLLEAGARKAAMDLKGAVPDAEWRAAWNATCADISAKAYRFHGAYATSAIQSYGGIVLLMTVLGSVEQPEGKPPRPVTEDEMADLGIERDEEVVALFNQIYEESFPNLKARAARKAAASGQTENS